MQNSPNTKHSSREMGHKLDKVLLNHYKNKRSPQLNKIFEKDKKAF